MSDASDFLTKWVRKNITPTTAHFHNDTLTAGRLAEECLWEAQGENLSAAEVTDAVGGNDTGFRKLLVDAHVHGVVSRAVHPKLFIACKLMRIEEMGDTLDLDVGETGTNWALFHLRLGSRNDPVELHLNRLGTHVRLGDHFGAE